MDSSGKPYKTAYSLGEIVQMTSGIYRKPVSDGTVTYLQASHFDEFGALARGEKSMLNNIDAARHLLLPGDVLFAAKGITNSAVVYQQDMGPAVASSSFIILRLLPEYRGLIGPDYLAWYIRHGINLHVIYQQKLGSTIPSISMKELAILKIAVPSAEKQETILRVQELHNREKTLRRELDHQKDLFIQKQLLIATIL